MPDDALPPLADLIAKTPGAQTREQALAHIKARRARLLAQRPIDTRRDDDIGAPEPVPLIDRDDYAARFWERLAAKDEAKKSPPPRGNKPHLVVDNSEPSQPPKKK